jgi:hypothetical protein
MISFTSTTFLTTFFHERASLSRLGVFVSVTTSSPPTRARVPRTRSNFSSKSMSDQCKASASPRRNPVFTNSSSSGAYRLGFAAKQH